MFALGKISPLVAPTMNGFMRSARLAFKIPSYERIAEIELQKK